jgi:hypothetical protein
MLQLKDLKEDDKIIVAKSLAFSISSPIDTFRQNILIKKPFTLKKTCIGMSSGLLSSSLISVTCHKTISYLEKYNINQLLSVAIGVLMANVVKIPIIYNYKKVQTGIKLTRCIPFNNLKNVMKISLIEDIIEESIKYTLSKKRMKTTNNTESLWESTLLESGLLFSLSYPFDILKNRGVYGISNLNGNKLDFATKVLHKNLQNVMFLQLISK